MRVIVSTCGTSVLTHQTPDEFRTLLNRLSNRQQDELGEHLSAVEAHIAQRRDQMRTADIETARKMSAELNGILGVYGGTLPPEARSDRHLLVASDTYLGNTGARIVADWLTANGIPDVQVCVIKNLVTDSLETFRFGVQELVQWCEETLPGHRKTYRIIFNLTGGFKGVQGVMNTLAHAYADEIVYIFETGRDLLRIPTLPLNWDPVAIARAHLPALRRLALGIADSSDIAGLPEVLVLAEKDDAGLSLVGEMVWQKAAPVLYAERLLDSPSPRIRYSPRFERQVADVIEPDRRVRINRAIDALERWLAGHEPPKSFQVKPVEGKHPTLPQVTHECYAWSDRDAKRIFFSLDNGAIVLEDLGQHL